MGIRYFFLCSCCNKLKMLQKLVQNNSKWRTNYNPLGVAKKGGVESKFAETAGQMTVGHIRSYKFVRFGEARVYLRLFQRERTTVESALFFEPSRGIKIGQKNGKLKKSILLGRYSEPIAEQMGKTPFQNHSFQSEI